MVYDGDLKEFQWHRKSKCDFSSIYTQVHLMDSLKNDISDSLTAYIQFTNVETL